MKRGKSRKKTSWDGVTELMPTQKFLREQYTAHYADRHRLLAESGEADMINSYVPKRCPFCSSESFRKFGYTRSGTQRYLCAGCEEDL